MCAAIGSVEWLGGRNNSAECARLFGGGADTMILALAGRRIDRPDATDARFPLQNVERVTESVRKLLAERKVTGLVSSAACGADLIALSEAGKLGIRRRVVLPSSREKFRQSSVVDRPGEWGGMYDKVMDELSAAGDVLVLNTGGKGDPYTSVSHTILDEASAMGKEQRQLVDAVMIWDGVQRDNPDYTAEFGTEARRRGMAVLEIKTA
jgi:hypothetical protein